MSGKTVFKAIVMVLLLGGAAEAAFGTDIVGRAAVESFGAMLGALKDPPAADEAEDAWVLTAPDGAAAFGWYRGVGEFDVHKIQKATGAPPLPIDAFGAYLRFDAEPFVRAGLDVSRLPAEMRETKGKLTVGRKRSAPPEYDGAVTPLASFEQLVKAGREFVGYHAALDHYGYTVSDGFVFEWAKDMDKNDKDIVFVLDPQIFIEAGADPAKIEGWAYAKVPLEDARGRKFEAEKFLKPFNLK